MGFPLFNRAVAAQHRRVDATNWDDIYVVGDVHGCRADLDVLLSKLELDTNDLVVFVGDLVCKGPDNHGVVTLVRDSPNMISVRGNNEEKIIRGETSVPDLTEADTMWLASLPVAISWEGYLAVHAGVDPRKSLTEHTVDDLQTMRSLAPGGSYDAPFWFDYYEGPERVVFGHTVLERPLVDTYSIGLDTGCVYGGALTAYDCTRDRSVSVEANQTVKERSDEKFLHVSTDRSTEIPSRAGPS